MQASAVASNIEVDVAKDYDSLTTRLKDVSALEGIGGLLGWDEMTMMPEGAAGARAAQKVALSSVIHSKSTDPELGNLLSRLKASSASLDKYKQANVREAARAYTKATCIPEELVRREANLASTAHQAWVKARQAGDWQLFAPSLKEWVVARRERAALIDASRPAYDVLADDYDPGLTSTRVAEVFCRVRDGLVPLLKKIRDQGVKPDTSWLQGDFDTAKQAELCNNVSVALGFNLEKGRLDVSVHPFTGGAHPTDVRMTTRFKQNDFMEGLTGAIHETGHALYEQGRNLEFDGLPVNSAAGMVIHESQSLLWERMVGLSRPFAKYLLPKLHASFPDALPKKKTSEDLYVAMNAVKDISMIRVEADEVTYPMHVILRFEIERGLIDGSVEVDDVPALWNSKMKEYLGVEPKDDAEGCLQDIHWSMGALGYFPTYSLGAMSAVQIFEAAKKDLPTLDEDIANGDFAALRIWLNEKVHSLGSLYPKADDLLEAITGKPLDPDLFLKYLEDKYSDIYKLN